MELILLALGAFIGLKILEMLIRTISHRLQAKRWRSGIEKKWSSLTPIQRRRIAEATYGLEIESLLKSQLRKFESGGSVVDHAYATYIKNELEGVFNSIQRLDGLSDSEIDGWLNKWVEDWCEAARMSGDNDFLDADRELDAAISRSSDLSKLALSKDVIFEILRGKFPQAYVVDDYMANMSRQNDSKSPKAN